MAHKARYKKGDLIGGRFLVHQVLMGGMGEVYLGYDNFYEEPRALKTFQSHLSSPQGRQLFHDEIYKWVQLEKHPNIVRCYMMETLDNQPFMQLEWVAGEEGKGTDLRSWLRYGPLDLRLALDFTIDICRGLIHANQKQPGIVHRDLKPGNILIAQEPLAKITDFGLATIARETLVVGARPESSPDAHLTRHEGGAVGTPPYMPLEQWRNEELDARSDIYAIGCILHEMLTVRMPFRPPFSQTRLISAWRRAHEQTLPTLPTTIPAGVATIMQTCLAKERDNRFASVEELLEALSQQYTNIFAQPPKPLTTSTAMTATDYNNRGNTYAALARYDDALADYGQAIALQPDLAKAYLNRGNTYRILDRDDYALADYGQAIALQPNDATAYYNRGITYNDLGRDDNALADYRQAIALKPDYADAYYNRGNTYHNLTRYDDALGDYGQAITLQPDFAKAYNNRGLTYQALARDDDALADYGQAIALQPDLADAYFNVGVLFGNRGQHREALPYFEKAARLGDSQAAQYAQIARQRLGMAPAQQASPQQAFDAFQRARSLDEMRQVVGQFPFMVGSEFLALVEQAIVEQVPSEHRPYFEQRLLWLRQIAKR